MITMVIVMMIVMAIMLERSHRSRQSQLVESHIGSLWCYKERLWCYK
jgi:preprotein translocase subunit YajC